MLWVPTLPTPSCRLLSGIAATREGGRLQGTNLGLGSHFPAAPVPSTAPLHSNRSARRIPVPVSLSTVIDSATLWPLNTSSTNHSTSRLAGAKPVDALRPCASPVRMEKASLLLQSKPGPAVATDL